MKPRGLLIAAALLAVLTGVLYWSNRHPAQPDAAANASADAPVKVLSLDPTNIVKLSIQREGQLQADLSRNGSGAWQITAPKSEGADQDAVSGVLAALSSLNADRMVDNHPSNLAQYGLATPVVEIDLGTKDNKTQKLIIGDPTPSGNSYYFMLAGDPRLFTFSSDSKSSLVKTSDDLRDKRLITADFDNVTQIQLLPAKSGPKQDVTFARDKDNWQIVKPETLRTDTDQVNQLIQSLQGVRMNSDAGTDDTKIAAAFNSAMPYITAKVTGSSGTQELDIREAKNNNDYYAKSSAVPGIYGIAAADAGHLNKSLVDFRKKTLFDFGMDDPDKIEIHDGAKAYFITHTGDDWWGPDGKKLDTVTVLSLVDKLRALSTSDFRDSGFTAPSLEITVASNGNKRVEKVLISKNGNSFIAKRDGESGLYEIPASDVTDLQHLSAGLGPTSTAK